MPASSPSLSESPSTFSAALLGPGTRRIRQGRRFLESGVLAPPPRLEWTTPHQVALELPALQLLDFTLPGSSSEEGTSPLPVLIVAPEVNGATIADYGPGQSLVQTLQGQGFPGVFVTAWRSATAGTRRFTVDDSLDAIDACIDHLGGRVHLLGICQGGWEAAAVVAQRPEVAETLTLGAAAIDFHAGNGPITRLCRSTPFSTYQAMVGLGGGVMRGDFLRFGFDLLQAWDRFLVEPMRAWNGLDDPPWQERQARLRSWYASEKDLPGPQYLSVVKDLFQENRLIRGEFVARGEKVDLSRITCPLALLAGTRDHITLSDQVFAAEGACRSKRVRRFAVDAGHVGVFIGKSVLDKEWPKVVSFWREAGSDLPGA